MLPSFLDRQNEERELGVTDVSSHREFIMNSVTEAPPADVALIRVPADGNFTPAIAKGNHRKREIQCQTCQHSRPISLLGVKQI